MIKTNIQAGKEDNVRDAKNVSESSGVTSLWRFYNVMISLDIPFQVINFILYGFLSDLVLNSGIETNIWTRLAVGIGCGMTAAAVTCPIDVCKTRIQTSLKSAENSDEKQIGYSERLLVNSRTSKKSFDESKENGIGRVSLLNNDIKNENDYFSGTVKEEKEENVKSSKKPETQDIDTGLMVRGTAINQNVLVEMKNIAQKEGIPALF